MVKDRHFLVMIIEAQMVSEISRPFDLDAANSSKVSGIENFFQLHCFPAQSRGCHEMAVNSIFHCIRHPWNMFAACEAILKAVDFHHGK
jgi:hypothetical protein